MDDRTDGHGSDHPLVKATSLLVVGAGLLALFLGQDWFWMVFALGFAVLVPLVKVVTGRSDGVDAPGVDAARGHGATADAAREHRTTAIAESDAESKQAALDRVRDRYARGELSDEAFERKVARLLDTETVEDARERVRTESLGTSESAETDTSGR